MTMEIPKLLKNQYHLPSDERMDLYSIELTAQYAASVICDRHANFTHSRSACS